MAALSLSDLLRQCRLARWEEEHGTAETLEILPTKSVSYVRLFCAGQLVKFKICASGPISASIGFDHQLGSSQLADPFDFNPELTCCILERHCTRSEYYRLTVSNQNADAVLVTVRIHAEVRPPSLRTRVERAVNWAVEKFPRRLQRVQVLPAAGRSNSHQEADPR